MSKRILTILFLVAAFTVCTPINAGATESIGVLAGPTVTNDSGVGCTPPANCTFFQHSDVGGTLYEATSAGVITSFAIQQPISVSTADTVQLKVFRPGLGDTWTIVGESAVSTLHDCGGNPCTPQPSFRARLAVQAGDRIGLTVNFDDSDTTPWQYATTNVTDEVASVTGTSIAVGTTLQPSDFTTSTYSKLNLAATVEPDADHDGYGDETQDLCPTDPTRFNAGCSGSPASSKFENIYFDSTGCTPSTCITFNRTIAGESAGSPINGVVVRFRTFSAPGVSLRWSVLHPEGPNVRLTGQSPEVTATSSRHIVESGEVRIPITAGDFVGLASDNHEPDPGHDGLLFFFSGAGAGDSVSIDPGDGNPGLSIGQLGTPNLTWGPTREFAIGADVEPDADHDGYGDETQDPCPNIAGTNGPCPAPPATTQPVAKISGLKLSPSRFRVDTRGAAISRRAAHKGSSIRLSLSTAADVKFVVSQKKSGRLSGGKCKAATRKTRTKKRCTYLKRIFSFTKSLATGANKIAFSGRYRRHHKSRSLHAGSYSLAAIGATGGSTAKASFRIVNR